MSRATSIPGERKIWVAYLLWPTIVGHRWYLSELSPVYTLTLGYFGIMWFADLFRVPSMVKEFNSLLYQRTMARSLQRSWGGTRDPQPEKRSTRPERIAPQPSIAGRVNGTSDVHGGGSETRVPPVGETVTTVSSESLSTENSGGILLPPRMPASQPKKIASTRNVVVGAGIAVAVVLIGLLFSFLVKGSVKESGEGRTQTPAVAVEETESKLSISLTTPSGLTVSSPNVILEGVTEPDASVTVLGCANAPVQVQAGDDGRFNASLVLKEGNNILTAIAEKAGRKGSTSCSLTYQLDESSYKAQCKAIEFKVLNKNPDAYRGQKYYATGQIVQIMESRGATDIRMNVTRDQWGYWDDTIYVTFAGTVPAYEDSIIRVWGEIKGSYSYTSVAGWNITLPLVEAKYIEVVQP